MIKGLKLEQVDFKKEVDGIVENQKGTYETEEYVKPVKFPRLPKRCNSFKPKDSKSKEWTKVYDGLRDKVLNGCLVVICGSRGTGKTQLGVCLVKRCCYAGHSALYEKSMDIFLRIRTAKDIQGDTEKTAIEEYVKPYLLVIDAHEVRGGTPFEDRLLNHVIDKRYDAEKSTIIITNDKQDDLPDILGCSIYDRMIETGGIIEMKWESLRG